MKQQKHTFWTSRSLFIFHSLKFFGSNETQIKMLKMRFLRLAWEDFNRTLQWFPRFTIQFCSYLHPYSWKGSQQNPWTGTVGNISGKGNNWDMWNVPFRISVKICRILLIACMPSGSPALPVWRNARELRRFARDFIIEMMPAVKSGRDPTQPPSEIRTLKE